MRAWFNDCACGWLIVCLNISEVEEERQPAWRRGVDIKEFGSENVLMRGSEEGEFIIEVVK